MVDLSKAINLRASHEDRLVADGDKLFRLPARFKIPKGLTEVFTIQGKNVYQSNGILKQQFKNLQRIQPRNNPTLLARSIWAALYHGHGR